MQLPTPRSRQGFTLIELIIVIAVIAIIAAVVFVAIDPAKRLNASRNSTRWSDVTAILNAIKTYQADNGGTYPAALSGSLTATNMYVIGKTATCATYAAACTSSGAIKGVNLTVPATSCVITNFDTFLAAYLKKIPKDPSSGTDNDTKYWVNKDANGLLTVGTCNAQGEGAGGSGTPPVIQVSA